MNKRGGVLILVALALLALLYVWPTALLVLVGVCTACAAVLAFFVAHDDGKQLKP